MSSRSIIYAGIASFALVLLGAVIADAAMVVGGLGSTLVAAFLLAIKTDETARPMHQLLFDDQAGMVKDRNAA